MMRVTRAKRRPGRKPLAPSVYRMGPFMVAEPDMIWLMAHAEKRQTTVSALFREWLRAARNAEEAKDSEARGVAAKYAGRLG